MIDSQRVDAMFRDCLFRSDELPSDGSVPANAIIVESVTGKYGLNAERLEGYRAEIGQMLAALPPEFSKGGGWSFLNACTEADGTLWTGSQLIVDNLLALGIGTKQAKILLPRELWTSFPGGVPYFAVTTPSEIP